jgi:hypothetical protein
MPQPLARSVGGILIVAGFGFVLGRKALAAWTLRLRGEPPAEEGDARGYGAPFMVVGDVMIAVGALLLLGIVPQAR